MAVDYGRRRVGVAATDPTRTLVSPRATLLNADPPTEPTVELLELLGELEPARVIVGIAYEMDGSEGKMAQETREFAQHLREHLSVPVEEWDERLTTAEAEELLRETGRVAKPGRKGRVDRAAAAVLLRSWLAAR